MSRFELGRLVCTRCMHDRTKIDADFQRFFNESLARYMRCDWGDLREEDKALNDEAVRNGNEKVLASYKYPKTGERIWIVTEADRSATTILFPLEY